MLFSDLLIRYRIENKVTQLELIVKIQTLDLTFNKLDEITLSRWENGHTKPAINKQGIILIGLGFRRELQLVTAAHYKKSNKLVNIIKNRFNQTYSSTDSPYSENLSKINVNISKIENRSVFMRHAHFQKNTFGTTVTKEEMIQLIEGCDCCRLIEYSSGSNLLAHTVFYIMNWQTITELYHSKYNEMTIKETPFQKSKILYIYSDYSSVESIVLYKAIYICNWLFQNEIEYVLLRNFQAKLAHLFTQLGGEVVHKGPENPNGIKYHGKKYSWVTYLIPSINIMTSQLAALKVEDLDCDFFFSDKQAPTFSLIN